MRDQSLQLLQEHTIEDLFSLAITQKQKSTKIFMQLLHDRVNTAHLPEIVDMLDEHLPNVLRTECFNEDDIPFHIEVKNTEIGHLFEHILLEYLCQLKIAKGADEAVFSGRTRWNWVKDPMGTFHIRLNCGEKDADILPLAVEKTISLMKLLLQEEEPVLTKNNVLVIGSVESGLKNGEGHKNNPITQSLK